jgi:hypothetical protein
MNRAQKAASLSVALRAGALLYAGPAQALTDSCEVTR